MLTSFSLRSYTRRTSLLLALCCICTQAIQAQQTDTLRVINWNIEFFGAQTQNPARQVSKVTTIMQNLQADVYALSEIVNKDSLKKVVTALGPDYHFIVAGYGSLAPDTQSSYYPSAQKLALVYRKSKVNILGSRAFMASSATAYSNFATGRMPFQVRAQVKNAGGFWQPIEFYVLHAKAQTDFQSCQRRTAAAIEMKDSLDNNKSGVPFIILGDFNDDFDESICGGNSNYAPLVADSSGNHFYFSPTLALSVQGISSIFGYPGFIDHVLVSDEVKTWYVPNSAKLYKTEVSSWVSSYTDDVSDHYPVGTKYLIPANSNFSLVTKDPMDVKLVPNPSKESVSILGFTSKKIQVKLYNSQGLLMKEMELSQPYKISTEGIPDGIYLIKIQLPEGESISKRWCVQH